MRSGWLKGQFSLRHYRRTGGLLIAAGLAVNLPSIIAQWHLGWDYRWCAFLLQARGSWGAPLQTIGYAALAWGFWPQLCQSRLVGAIACVGRMAAKPTIYCRP
ncbi:inner membrane protein [Klebsiella michiganensis]|nr:inner membrane protein [Klebsiella michiganensis]